MMRRDGLWELSRFPGGLSWLGHSGNGRNIDEQISVICSRRSNHSCRYRLRLLDGAEFLWLGVLISAGRLDEPGLCRWLPTR